MLQFRLSSKYSDGDSCTMENPMQFPAVPRVGDVISLHNFPELDGAELAVKAVEFTPGKETIDLVVFPVVYSGDLTFDDILSGLGFYA